MGEVAFVAVEAELKRTYEGQVLCWIVSFELYVFAYLAATV
jgi:hypothetical protein